MAEESGIGGWSQMHFSKGNRGLLVLLGQRFLVSLLEVGADRVRVTFPTTDFPAPGMHVDLEFHDLDGYASYDLEVLDTPRGPGEGLLLRRPPRFTRRQHRSFWRVPADFRAELRDHVHPRRTVAPIINISAGGLLVRTNLDLKLGDNVDLWFTLPGGGEPQQMVGRVVHVNSLDDAREPTALVGLEFVSPDPVAQRDIAGYVWRRVHALGPEELSPRRRATDQFGR